MKELRFALSRRYPVSVIHRSPGYLRPERFSHRLALVGLGLLIALGLVWLKANINWQEVQVLQPIQAVWK